MTLVRIMGNLKRLIFFIPVLCGIALVVVLVNSKKPPERPDIEEVSRPVSIIAVQRVSVIPKVKGYGYVTPTESWEAIPEVSGKVIETHAELKKGAFIRKGELLVRLDPQSYGLAKSRGEASIMTIDAQLLELDQEKVNTLRLLKTEEQTLKLTKKELDRKKKLQKKGVISASELEAEQKIYLAQESSVNNLKNSLALIPSRKEALLAQKQSDVSSLSELSLDVEKTVIRAPFDCRISEVSIEKDQFAAAGKTLLKAISIASVEIPVQLSPNDFVHLLSQTPDSSPVNIDDFSMDKFREIIGLSATVRLPLFSKEAVWKGQFMRTGESLDIQTGAITAYVSVKRPYDMVIPGIRPPLVPNMYCEVELQGNPKTKRYVIPLKAIHKNEVYTVDEESRLKRVRVEVEMIMDDVAVIQEGLEGRVKVITSDLIPAIDGQLLEPDFDEIQMTDLSNYHHVIEELAK